MEAGNVDKVVCNLGRGKSRDGKAEEVCNRETDSWDQCRIEAGFAAVVKSGSFLGQVDAIKAVLEALLSS